MKLIEQFLALHASGLSNAAIPEQREAIGIV